ncbi:MAG: L-fucose/L-arabinose isomerase family protein [Anaerolineae bacterium]|jgi:L-fucose isomerase|nr:fucose isomerase [Chloroflexota bacterium]
MRTVPIGIVMMNDARPHVIAQNEQFAMGVVNRWADIIRKGVRNVDGTAPEVVVGSESIKSVRTAQAVGEQLRRAGCRIVIMCYTVWNFPYLVWPFYNSVGRDVPVLSLSNNSGQYPGNVGLLATDGALRQAGVRTHRIVGDIDDPGVHADVFDWIRAAQAVATIRSEVYGLYGGASMGMDTGFFHLVPTLKALGCTTEQVDQLLLTKVMENEIDEAEVEKGLRWFEGMLGDRLRYDGRVLTPETLKTQLRLYLAMQLVNKEHGFDFCGLKGQRELTEYVCLGDVAEMLLNDPYDWYGSKEPTVCATEADSYGAVTMQLLKYVSGGLPSLFMDVRLYRPDLDLWDWCNSGNHASWYAAQSMDPAVNMERVTFYPALEFYFKAGGASVEFNAMASPMTYARLGLWDDKPFMAILKGESVDLGVEQARAVNAETDPTWPHVHARVRAPFSEFLSVFPANHVHGTVGDKVRALTYLCEMSGIAPVVLGPEKNDRMTPIWERVL